MKVIIYTGQDEECKELGALLESDLIRNLNEPFLFIKEKTGWDRVASSLPVEIAIVDDEIFVKYD